MSASGKWTLAPAYDVTWCDGPGGYHQMDVLGEALAIRREQIERLGMQEAELTAEQISALITRFADVASGFTARAKARFAREITPQTLQDIQASIDDNLSRL